MPEPENTQASNNGLFEGMVEQGSTNETPEKEAQFFMMFLMTPGKADPLDSEIQGWQSELQQRINRFSAAHPNFRGFKAFKIDPSKSSHEQFNERN
jgi:hypothetical protein